MTSSGPSPKLLAAMGLGPPVQGPLKQGPYLWAEDELLKLYYGVNMEAPLRPELPDPEWVRIDATIGGVLARCAEARLRVVFLLAEDEAERRSELTYVFFEPLADVVVALTHRERDVSITATDHFWDELGDDFRGLSDRVERLLKDGLLPEALRLAAEELQRIFLPAAAP